MEKVGKIEEMERSFEDGMTRRRSKKKAAAKTLLNNAGIIFGVFLTFVVIIIVTTDIRLATWEEITGLGIDFLLLLFCSYTMYINCSDSGMRHGLRTDTYLDAVEMFDKAKAKITSCGNQKRMYVFCRHYIKEELKHTKMLELENVGFCYEDYLEKYLGLDDSKIDEDTELTKAQKKAVKKANSIDPIRLTPEMILRRARGHSRRSPLGMNPETKKKINFGVKFVSTIFLSLFLTVLIVDMVIEPTWIMFVSCMLKLISVVSNGFSGYKFGYENIVNDTANYMNDQTDLMGQAIQFFEGGENENSNRSIDEERT